MQYGFFIATIFYFFEVMVAGPCSSREANARCRDLDAPVIRLVQQILVSDDACCSVDLYSSSRLERKNNCSACYYVSMSSGESCHHPFELNSDDFHECRYFYEAGFGAHQFRGIGDDCMVGAGVKQKLRPSFRQIVMDRKVYGNNMESIEKCKKELLLKRNSVRRQERERRYVSPMEILDVIDENLEY